MLPAQGLAPAARDFNDWKRKNGVPLDGKVFSMTGWYPCVKEALLARGWHMNADRDSFFFDLKWTLKSNELKQVALGEQPGAGRGGGRGKRQGSELADVWPRLLACQINLRSAGVPGAAANKGSWGTRASCIRGCSAVRVAAGRSNCSPGS